LQPVLSGVGNAFVAVANYLANGPVSVLVGKGDGTFQAVTTYPVGIGPWYVAVGDLNGDGILDLAFTCLDGGVRVLLGNGDGTLTLP
jgi:hypothetical protein